MGLLDSPLGERLLASLDSGKPEDLSAAVGDVRAKVWAGSVTPADAGEVMALLEERREFQHVIDVGEAASRSAPLAPVPAAATARR